MLTKGWFAVLACFITERKRGYGLGGWSGAAIELAAMHLP
jgi:hypothetical protein